MKKLLLVLMWVSPLLQHGEGEQTREEDVRDCSDPDNIYLPATATNTTNRLMALREEMKMNNISAYIVPSSDAHLSEYVAPSNKKRQWISGFTGSAGTAVITMDAAAVWTDGRYFLQAERQLDCNWILMKQETPGFPSIEEWIISQLEGGSSVGAHPFLFSVGNWKSYSETFYFSSLWFQEVIPDFIDLIWEDRPPLDSKSLLILPTEYSGKTWQTKLSETRDQIREEEADALLLTKLDEIAWFFNLRGSDVPNTPVFTSYAFIPLNGDVIIYANVSLFNDEDVQNHLNSPECKVDESCVVVKLYEDARSDLEMEASSNSSRKFWMPSTSTTYGIYSVVDESQQVASASPIELAKAVKNPTEIEVMKQAHIYDAVALCEYLQWLEINVPLGGVTEISGAEVLKNFRLAQPTNQGLSFGSISASGPNGAVIHYGATPETNRELSTSEMYMVDSGGQYLGGTTDVTRTLHYGEPSDFEKEAFTLTLMGQIDVQKSVFPYGKVGNNLDILARRYLYEAGLEYRHGTGHGIGLFLAIHEYPPGFGVSTAETFNPLRPGMFTSIEPGYYEAGSFGLRHENINLVVEAVTKHQFEDYRFYTFDPVTLVPFQAKLIDTSLMSQDQIIYLNEYHENVREVVAAEAKSQGKAELKNWLEAVTAPLPTGFSPQMTPSIFLVVELFIASVILNEL